MKIPENYIVERPDNNLIDENSPIWDQVEDLAMDFYVGVDTFSHKLDSFILDKNDDSSMIGAVWYEVIENKFSFNIAIDEKHQGFGGGTILLDNILSTYEELKKSNSELALDIAVVNPKLMSAMFRRNAYVTSDLRESDGDHSVFMTLGAPLSDFVMNYAKENPVEYFNAINITAERQGMYSAAWAGDINEWAKSPYKLDDIQKSCIEEFLLNINLPELEKQCLWENVQVHSDEPRKTFPGANMDSLFKPEDLDDDLEMESAPEPEKHEHNIRRGI